MANIKVTIIDANRLRLEQDAKKGDVIDLRDVNEVDTSMLLEQIEKAQDKLYNDKLAALKESLRIEYNLKISEEKRSVELENEKLKSQLESQKLSIENLHKATLSEQQREYENKLAKLERDLALAESNIKNQYDTKITELKNQVANIELKKDNEYKDKIHLTAAEIQKLKNNLETNTKILNQEKEIAINKIITTKEKEIAKVKEQLSDLQRTRATFNVKTVGEDLEKWCDNEFQSQQLFGLNNITWEKDNLVIRADGDLRGTKADFIYKVFANDNKNENEILTSAILEMKSESKDTVVKQTNAQFYKKLDEDRTKKNLEYAVLVSELEMDNSNDIPIRKVNEYEKMFVVRPQYFMSFLSIITSFGLKYKDILLEHEEKRLEFKDLQDIINEFEEMKDSILNTTIKYIENHMETILKQTEAIQSANSKIIDSANTIINRHINTVINKIENFNINRITTKIENVQ